MGVVILQGRNLQRVARIRPENVVTGVRRPPAQGESYQERVQNHTVRRHLLKNGPTRSHLYATLNHRDVYEHTAARIYWKISYYESKIAEDF